MNNEIIHNVNYTQVLFSKSQIEPCNYCDLLNNCPKTASGTHKCENGFSVIYKKDTIYGKRLFFPKILYVKSKFFPIFRGIAIPYFNAILINDKYRYNKKLIDHEVIHLNQIRRMSLPVYLFRYIFQLIFIGYDTMPIELEARQDEPELFNYRYRNWKKY